MFVGRLLDSWSATPDAFPAEVRAQYIEKFRDAATVHAICEQYRAAATLDHEHDRADREAGRRIGCPVLALWDPGGAVASWYDPLEIWRQWADDVTGAAIGAGHFLPEEAPDVTSDRLLAFL